VAGHPSLNRPPPPNRELFGFGPSRAPGRTKTNNSRLRGGRTGIWLTESFSDTVCTWIVLLRSRGCKDAVVTQHHARSGRPRRLRLILAAAAVLAIFVSPLAGAAAASADAALPTFTTVPTLGLGFDPVVGRSSRIYGDVWNPQPDSETYQWFANSSPIDGAVAPYFTPQAEQLGESLTVSVTAAKVGYESQTVSTGPSAPVVAELTAGRATIEGVPRVGRPSTVDPGQWSEPGVTFEYQWSVDGARLTGATDSTYTPAATDVGKMLDVLVVGRKAGFSYSSTSAPEVRVAAVEITPGAISIAGLNGVGQLLYADTSLPWYPQPAAFAYQWLRDGADIAGAVSRSYLLSPADAGHRIAFRATGTFDGFPDRSVISPATANVLPLFDHITRPVVVGSGRLGERLTATMAAWTPAATHFLFNWFVNGVQVVFEDSNNSFFPGAQDLGKTVTVQAIGWSASRAHETSAVSLPSAVLSKGHLAIPKITLGSVHLNVAIRPTISGVTPYTPIHYQWTANGHAIAGATGASYTPTPDRWHQYIQLKVTVSAPGYVPSSGASERELAGTGRLTDGYLEVHGDYRVGSTLHAVPRGWGPFGIHVRYKWVSERPTGWVTVSTAQNYTPTKKDYGHKLDAWMQGYLAHFAPTVGWYGNGPFAVKGALFPSHPTPVITGTDSVGSLLTAHHGAWSGGAAVRYTYQWYSRASAASPSVAIAHATGAHFRILPTLRGKMLIVKVTAHRDYYQAAFSVSARTQPVP
jgi:hypothetical protein